MRIDVDLDHRDVEAELAALYGRLRLRGDTLVTLPIFAPRAPGLVFKYREVDGEFYVYAEDAERSVLAGVTVFNRVPEVDIPAGRFVRSPHSRYAREYRSKGVASAVYQWALRAGMCLVSGPRQSEGAFRLWASLARSHELAYVQIKGQRLLFMDPVLAPHSIDKFESRMLLLGVGAWSAMFLTRRGDLRRARMCSIRFVPLQESTGEGRAARYRELP